MKLNITSSKTNNIFVITHKYAEGQEACISTSLEKKEIENILLYFNSIVFDIDTSEELSPANLAKALKHYKLCDDYNLNELEATTKNIIDMYWVWDRSISKIEQIEKELHLRFKNAKSYIATLFEEQKTTDIHDYLISLSRHYMNTVVVPKINTPKNNTYFIVIAKTKDVLNPYSVGLLSSDQITSDVAIDLFKSRKEFEKESLIQVVIDFSIGEYVPVVLFAHMD